jgi:thiosulfate dehydrogenase
MVFFLAQLPPGRPDIMKKDQLIVSIAMIVSFAVIAALISIFSSRFISFKESSILKTTAPKAAPLAEKSGLSFHPPSPQDSPAGIKDAVELGYNIIMNTQKYASLYVGNKLSCKNCHFKGGITPGGINGGLSLVGVGAVYPKYGKRQNDVVDLAARTNACFERSMNGKALPPDSRELLAVLTYYQWISKGLPVYENISWLGLKQIQSSHSPNAQNGEQIFGHTCQMCHGARGQGTPAAPPVWGQDSFNDGASLANLEDLAAFIALNMPYENPSLSADEALDVSAYVSGQPRPRFMKK